MKIDFTKNNYGFYLNMAVIAIVLFSVDRWSKQMAVLYLKTTEKISIIPGVLELRYVENHGAAFGILQNKQVLFYIITFIICLAIIYFFFKTPVERKFYPLFVIYSVLISGAVGNLYDRITEGYVVDFIYFSIIDFPVFNVADICITCSMAILIVLLLFYYSDEDITKITKNS